ncbi:hypothetical protein CDAR_44122 [Caerostris darwini]|uniref:ZP domain-containing protein n=1 Tax=Caerostris darwini TaxID=1538125 RepID=A0AAV4UMN9_9ARAC|nr:hypothetical protein CDAR_44122 [Caerostris darwini]
MIKLQWLISTVIFLIKVSASPSVQNETSTLTSSNRNRKIILDVACSDNAMMGKFLFKDPFHGSVYVQGFPFECRASGNGTTEVTLIFSTNKCGTKVTKLPNGKSQYEAVINLQFDNTVQRLSDETYLLNCTPQDVVVISPKISGTGSESNIGPKASLSTKPFREQDFDGWLEILQGKLPSLTPLTKPVHVGENLTMLIKVKHPDGFDSKIINCIASDGSDLNKQLLIDSDGCSVNSGAMSNFREKRGMKFLTKIMYTTFQAFRFPRRNRMHIRCSITFCNKTCHKDNCDALEGTWTRHQSYMQTDFSNGINTIEVFDSFEILEPRNDSKTSSFQEHLTGTGSSKEELFCLNSTRILILISILLSVLLISLVVTICTCVRAKELRRRLLHQSYPYGKVSNCS